MMFPVQGIAISRVKYSEILGHTEVFKIVMTSLLSSENEE